MLSREDFASMVGYNTGNLGDSYEEIAHKARLYDMVMGRNPARYIVPITEPIEIVAIGDSRLAAGHITVSTTNSVIDNTIGDLATVNHAPQYVVERWLGGAARAKTFAISGARLTPATGRTDDVLTYQLPLALANCDERNTIFFLMATINDRADNIPVATQIAGLHTIVTTICGRGGRVVIALEPPQKNAGWNATNIADHAATVFAMLELEALFPEQVGIADCMTPVMDSTGAAYADGSVNNPYSTGDNVHAKWLGGWHWSKAFYAVVMAKKWFIDNHKIWMSKVLSDTDNLLTNPEMAGFAGTATAASGTAPTSWVCTRSASNSWLKTFATSGVHKYRANSTVYAVGDVISSLVYRDVCFVCSAVAGAATSAGSEPTMDTTLAAETVDGDITWTTIPLFDDYGGTGGVIFYGLGSANNTKGVLAQTNTIVNWGISVGDVIVGSIHHVALTPSFGCNIELRARNTTTKVNGGLGLSQNYPNSPMLGDTPDKGILLSPRELSTGGWTVPTCDTFEFRIMMLSITGFQQWHFFRTPLLKIIG